ncbi:MAG TPA: hypothetical protein VGP45_01960 [Marinobacter sp.]|nr:hypothetical protein [Marinobacter sp.]
MTTTVAQQTAQTTSPKPMSPQQRRKGRRMALLLMAVGFGPIILASAMFYGGWLNPAEHTNNGTLVVPVMPLSGLQLQTEQGKPLADRFGPTQTSATWLLLVVADNCTEVCQQLLYTTRQTNIALGKYATRVSRGAALTSLPPALAQRWSADFERMEQFTSLPAQTPVWPPGVEPSQAPQLLLVDPLGNIMMRYPATVPGGDVLDDLKHLLKISRIG